jgi:hypothetical protein
MFLPFALFLGLFLVSCSSNSAPSNARQSGTGTPTQNLAAHELNLRSTDVPSSWKTQPSSGGKNAVRSAMDSCVAQSAKVGVPATVAVSSNFLDTATGREVGSQVQIFDSPGKAGSAAALAGSGETSACIGPQVKAALSGSLPSDETVTGVTASVIPSGISVAGSFGQRVVATLSYPGAGGAQSSSDVTVDVLGFPHGTALIEVEFESPKGAPSASLADPVMSTLVARAKSS